MAPAVVCFDQPLGCAQSKFWSKSPFSMFFMRFQDFDAKRKKNEAKKCCMALFSNAGQHKNAGLVPQWKISGNKLSDIKRYEKLVKGH